MGAEGEVLFTKQQTRWWIGGGGAWRMQEGMGGAVLRRDGTPAPKVPVLVKGSTIAWAPSCSLVYPSHY